MVASSDWQAIGNGIVQIFSAIFGVLASICYGASTLSRLRSLKAPAIANLVDTILCCRCGKRRSGGGRYKRRGHSGVRLSLLAGLTSQI